MPSHDEMLWSITTLTRRIAMRVLMTGGYGFIGAWIAKSLLADGHEVLSFDLKRDPRRLTLIMSDEESEKVKIRRGQCHRSRGTPPSD